MENQSHGNSYYRLLAMAVLSFVAMFLLMYAMVDRWANVYPNLNKAYMAGLMTAPMVIIELLLMSAMYRRKGVNLLLITASVLVLIGCWVGIRQQVAIGDEQFVKAMVPHHAAAILMCDQSHLTDRPLQELCQSIVATQKSEIAQMKARLRALQVGIPETAQ